MKKTLLFLAMLASVLLACGGAPAYAEQAAPAQAYPALTDAQRAAFSGAQWEGYTLMLWRDAQATETSEAYAQAELGACAVLQKNGRNMLCLLGQDESKSWRVLAQSASLLRPDWTFDESAFYLSVSRGGELTFSHAVDGDWDEGATVSVAGGVAQVTAFHCVVYDGVRGRLSVQDSAVRLFYDGKTASHLEMLLPAPDLAWSFEGFDRVAAADYLRQMYDRRNDPLPLPPNDEPDALPEPQTIRFAKGKTYDVYTGPGTRYPRAGYDEKGNAVVSTNGWIQVFGREGDWLFIQYNIGDQRNRFGYITAKALPKGAQVPDLAFDARAAVATGLSYLTDDPYRIVPEIRIVPDGTDLLWLATLDDEWVYAEYPGEKGEKPVRGFIHRECIRLRSDFKDSAVLRQAGGEGRSSLYEQPSQGAERLGTYYDGVPVRVLEKGDDFTKARIGGDEASIEGYFRTENLVFGAAPTDVPSAVQRAEAFSQDAGMLTLRALPDPSAAPVGDPIFHSTRLEILGYLGDWAHVRSTYLEESGFLAADEVMPLPKELNYGEDHAFVKAGGAPLLLSPSDGAPVLLTLYEGALVTQIGHTGDYALVAGHDAYDGSLKGYLKADRLLPTHQAPASPKTLPCAVVRVQAPAAFGDYAYLKTSPHENGGDILPLSDGVMVTVMGEIGPWRYVELWNAKGYFKASDLAFTGAYASFGPPTPYGLAIVSPEAGQSEVRLYQFPSRDAASWNGESGAELTLLSDLGDWWQVITREDVTAFVPAQCLRITTLNFSQPALGFENHSFVSVGAIGETIEVRTLSWGDGAVLGTIRGGALATLLQRNDEWCEITTGAFEGRVPPDNIQTLPGNPLEITWLQTYGEGYATVGSAGAQLFAFCEEDLSPGTYYDTREANASLYLVRDLGEWSQVRGMYPPFFFVRSEQIKKYPFATLYGGEKAETSFSAGDYLVGRDFPEGVYSFQAPKKGSATIRLTGQDGALRRTYKPKPGTFYSAFFPKGAKVSIEGDGVLESINRQWIRNTTTSEFPEDSTGRYVVGPNIEPGGIGIRVMDGATSGYYVVSSLEDEQGAEPERVYLKPGETAYVLLDPGVFLEVYNCTLWING